jgi:hypothetical protein
VSQQRSATPASRLDYRLSDVVLTRAWGRQRSFRRQTRRDCRRRQSPDLGSRPQARPPPQRLAASPAGRLSALAGRWNRLPPTRTYLPVGGPHLLDAIGDAAPQRAVAVAADRLPTLPGGGTGSRQPGRTSRSGTPSPGTRSTVNQTETSHDCRAPDAHFPAVQSAPTVPGRPTTPAPSGTPSRPRLPH